MTDPHDRQQLILDFLREHGHATVTELSAWLGVSDSTVRKDLRHLASLAKVRRDHGGAAITEARGLSPEYTARMRVNSAAKRQIAQLAAQLVGDYSVIGLDGSSTAHYLARCLAGRHITVVTNGIYSALELASRPPTRVILIGGELWLEAGCTIGQIGRLMLGRRNPEGERAARAAEGLRMRQFFTSPGGLTLADGLLDIDPDENLIKEHMIALAQEVIVLADHSKLGDTALLPYAPLSAISHIVTDNQADPHFVRQLEEAGIQVLQRKEASLSEDLQGPERPLAIKSPEMV